MRRGLAAGLVAALVAGPALAHPMPNSMVVLSRTADEISAELTIPLSELEAALGAPARAEADLPRIEAYLRDHVSVRTGAVAWPLKASRLALESGEHVALKATLVFGAAPGAGAAELRYDAVTHRIASHYVLVWWRAAGSPKPLVRLQLPQSTVALPP